MGQARGADRARDGRNGRDVWRDLQGILGKSLQEIDGLEFPALEDAARNNVKE